MDLIGLSKVVAAICFLGNGFGGTEWLLRPIKIYILWNEYILMFCLYFCFNFYNVFNINIQYIKKQHSYSIILLTNVYILTNWLLRHVSSVSERLISFGLIPWWWATVETFSETLK